MLTIRGNDIRSGGDKVGWIEGDDIYNAKGRKVGYFNESEDDIYNARGQKIGYVEGSYVKTTDGRVVSFSTISSEVRGGSYPTIARAAVYLLL